MAVIDQNRSRRPLNLARAPLDQRRDGGLVNLPRSGGSPATTAGDGTGRLFVDPRAIERLMAAAPPPSKPTDANILALIARYAASVRYAGAALVWGDKSIVVHTVETLEPSKVDPWLVRWAGDTRTTDPAQRRLPPTAVAVAAGHVDLVAVYNVISQIVPEEDQPKLTNLDIVLTGVLMGQDRAPGPPARPGIYAYSTRRRQPTKADLAAHRPLPTRPGRSPSWWWCPSRKTDRPECRPEIPAFESPRRLRWRTHWKMLFTPQLALTAMDEKRNQGRSRITDVGGRWCQRDDAAPCNSFCLRRRSGWARG